MKHVFSRGLLLSLFALFISFATKADQLAYITRIQAEKTVKFLKSNHVNKAIIWCSCCEGDIPVYLTINNVFSRYTGVDSFYEVVLQGVANDGKLKSEPVDLAYVFLKSGLQAKSLGKLMNFKCDPCTLPFDWIFPSVSLTKKYYLPLLVTLLLG